MDAVILVDDRDVEIGTMEKLEAHRKGELHRAISVFVFNSKGELLLQRRAQQKYHSGGLWTNTCCSHPMPGEPSEKAAKRRLREEMGIDLSPEFSHKFIYKIDLDNDLIEHEYDHVFKAVYDGQPTVNKEEVEDWKYIDLNSLRADMDVNPDRYTHWFKLIMNDPRLKL